MVNFDHRYEITVKREELKKKIELMEKIVSQNELLLNSVWQIELSEEQESPEELILNNDSVESLRFLSSQKVNKITHNKSLSHQERALFETIQPVSSMDNDLLFLIFDKLEKTVDVSIFLNLFRLILLSSEPIKGE